MKSRGGFIILVLALTVVPGAVRADTDGPAVVSVECTSDGCITHESTMPLNVGAFADEDDIVGPGGCGGPWGAESGPATDSCVTTFGGGPINLGAIARTSGDDVATISLRWSVNDGQAHGFCVGGMRISPNLVVIGCQTSILPNTPSGGTLVCTVDGRAETGLYGCQGRVAAGRPPGPGDVVLSLGAVPLEASDGAELHRFGEAVVVEGDRAFVGSPYALREDGQRTGAVYVFERREGTWEEVDKLTPALGEDGDRFGSAVAIDGDRLVVGAPFDSMAAIAAGAVYVYDRVGSGWQETKLIAPDAVVVDLLGYSVAVDADRIIGGAPQGMVDGQRNGSAYVFELQEGTWIPTKLTASDGASFDFYGSSVAISRDRAIVGAFSHDRGNGAAYVYTREGEGWSEEKLNPSGLGTVAVFGASVAIDGDRAVVGAIRARSSPEVVPLPPEVSPAVRSGAAVVYDRIGDVWLPTVLTPRDPDSGDSFGGSVAVSGPWVAVGALGDDEAGADAGAGYLFEVLPGLVHESKVLPVAGEADAGFGWSVSISSGRLIVGAPQHDREGEDAGSAILYEFPAIG